MPPFFACIFSLQYLLPYLHIVLSLYINIIFSFSAYYIFHLFLNQPSSSSLVDTHIHEKFPYSRLPFRLLPPMSLRRSLIQYTSFSLPIRSLPSHLFSLFLFPSFPLSLFPSHSPHIREFIQA